MFFLLYGQTSKQTIFFQDSSLREREYDRNSSRNYRSTPVNGRNLSGKIPRLSGWNTAFIFRMLFRCFPTGTGRHFLTWADIADNTS